MQHSDLRAWPLPPKPSFWESVAGGSAILLLSVLLRLGLDQVIPGRLAFTTYFPATVLAAYLTGTPGGLIVLAGGLIGSWFTWLGPTTPLNFAVALIGDGVFGITGAIVVLAVAALREAIFELAAQDERARIINRELMHRNRNQFAVITTLATQAMERAGIDSALTASLRDRITAMARAQDLITFDGGRAISMERLVERVLTPIVPESSRLVASGNAIGISAGQVSGLALVLHELGTNALKYGAWSNSSGRVALSWQRTASAVLITWQERGGPPAALPPNSGLGNALIERAISGAAVERTFTPSGLHIVLRLPPPGANEGGELGTRN